MEQNELTDIIGKMMSARAAYYAGKPIMSDQEYDAMEETVRQFDPEHPILAAVGHEPAGPWPEARHGIPMGSLAKCHTEEDFRKWADKWPALRLIAQHKEDGASLSLDYDSTFTRGATRGDGVTGEDISPNVRLMDGFVPECPGFTGSVRAEILMPRVAFEAINSVLPPDERYENPRSAAAGISRRQDGLFCKYLMLIAYDTTEDLDEDIKIQRLQAFGFRTPWVRVGDAESIVGAYAAVRETRPKLAVDIDGVVVKVCDKKVQAEAGAASGRPRAQIAWKFDPPGATTTFLQEEWEVGRTGIVSPVANMEPVRVGGTTVRRATLHNVAEIKRLGIGRGDLVMLVKRGDIIPKITEVLEHKGVPLEIPTTCPACQSQLENDGVRLFCRNAHCPGRAFHRIMNWIRVTKVEQFGEAVARALSRVGRLNRIADLYSLKAEDIAGIEGWGAQSAAKIMSNINATKNLRPEVFLSAVGVPGVSDRTAEELVAAFGSVGGVLQATVEAISALKGYSDVSAAAITAGLREHEEEIRCLLNVVNVSAQPTPAAGPLAGQTFCFTGAMERPRSEYQAMVVAAGGKNLSGVTKDLNYLVCNENKGSSKSVKAEKFGTKIITEKEFLIMMGLGASRVEHVEGVGFPPGAQALPSLFEEET